MPNSPVKKQYVYTDLLTLKRAQESKRDVHVIAVVKFFRPPIKTRGTSYSMTLGLVDPSLDESDKLICNVLNDVKENLPQVTAPGDIVVFHRLCVESFAGSMRGSGLPGRGFACGAFSGAPTSPLSLLSAWPNLNVTRADYAKAAELKEWAQSHQCALEREIVAPAAQPGQSAGASSLEEVGPLRSLEQVTSGPAFFDLIGHVLAKFQFAEEPNCVLLRLWDGTPAQLSFQNVENLSEEDICCREVLRMPRVRWLSRHRFVDVAIYDDHVSSTDGIHPGHVVLVTNVHIVLSRSRHARRHRGIMWELRLHGGGQRAFNRSVRRLDDADGEGEALRTRLMRAYDEMKVTEVHTGASMMTLNEVLASSRSNPTWKYFVRARVQALAPSADTVLQLLRWFCPQCGLLRSFPEIVAQEEQDGLEGCLPCPACEGHVELTFLLQIVFEDTDGWIRAHVWREHALHFFGQYLSRPSQLLTDVAVFRSVSACLDSLPGNEMDCMLVSYVPSAASVTSAIDNSDSNVQFQVIETQLRR